MKRLEGVTSILIVLVVAIMVIPLPWYVLDLLLALNFSLSIAILLLTMYIKEPLDFSVFPSLLLVMTLYRLALNVSSTRLILLRAHAGRIIEAFGRFVVGGNEVVGIVVFLILVIIQFVVITKGAERVAEVAARFTLDGMPGKQMSIDADLNAGVITEEEARQRRDEVQREADFYGAMDGAVKFVKGDAVAGLIITVINLVGGFAVGVLQHGLTAQEAWHRFALLTVGDGLVAQLPALVISAATGIIVTRSASQENLGVDVTRQITSDPRALKMTGFALIGLALVPGLPTIPLLCLGGVWLLLSSSVERARMRQEAALREAESQRKLDETKSPEAARALIKVDPLEIEFGIGLLALADPSQGGDLMDRIVMVRRQIASELGILIPMVRVRDNFGELGPNTYVINLRGAEIARGEVYADRLMAMAFGTTQDEIPGIKGQDPTFGLPAVWIPRDAREEAELKGYTVIEPSAVIATHFSETMKKHAAALLTRQETQRLLDLVKSEDAVAVDELVPNLLTVGEVQRVLQNLLREGIPIKDLVSIIETMGDAARVSRDVEYVTAKVRQGLSRLITRKWLSSRDPYPVATIDPDLEKEILDATKRVDGSSYVAIAPERLTAIMKSMVEAGRELQTRASRPVFLSSSAVRSQVYQIASRVVPDVVCLAYEELDDTARIEGVKVVRVET